MNMNTDIVEKQASVIDVPVEAQSTTPMALLSKAMSDPNFNPDVLQKLMDMQERWEDRDAEKQFNAAFAQMQSELPVIIREADGHNCKYETLESVLKQVRPHMVKHGFAATWATTPDADGNDVVMTCTLAHVGGHSISTSGSLPPDNSGNKNTAQAAGSSRTYLQRYLFKGLIGITVADDDDGAMDARIDDAQKEAIIEKMKEVGADTAAFLKFMGVASVDAILDRNYRKAMNALNAKAAKK